MVGAAVRGLRIMLRNVGDQQALDAWLRRAWATWFPGEHYPPLTGQRRRKTCLTRMYMASRGARMLPTGRSTLSQLTAGMVSHSR